MNLMIRSLLLAGTLFCCGCGQPVMRPVPPPRVAASSTMEARVPKHPAAVKLDVQPPGVYEHTIQRDDGTVLRFTISIPDGYTDQRPSPLIVALHYGGRVTPFYGRGFLELLVAPALGKLKAILLAPDAIAGGWTSEENEDAVIQIMDSVIASYNVDPGKTLLTGYSRGGTGTWYLAGRNQDRFAAAIPISGRPRGQADWKIPVYVIHSREDDVVPLAPTEAYVEQLKSQGDDVQLVVVEGITHYETFRFVDVLRRAVPWIKRSGNEGSAGEAKRASGDWKTQKMHPGGPWTPGRGH